MKQGQYVKCPQCEAVPYVATRDIVSGDAISASMFKGVNGYSDPVSGDPAFCPQCHANIFAAPILDAETADA